METFTQPKITGYRQLSAGEAHLMNEGKELAGKVGEFIERLKANSTIDQRWVAIATTELQQGFMALTRSIAQPTTF